jgi:hypothetical protein
MFAMPGELALQLRTLCFVLTIAGFLCCFVELLFQHPWGFTHLGFKECLLTKTRVLLLWKPILQSSVASFEAMPSPSKWALPEMSRSHSSDLRFELLTANFSLLRTEERGGRRSWKSCLTAFACSSGIGKYMGPESKSMAE